MPQTKSAAKALRQTHKKTLRNNSVKKELASLSRNFKKAINSNDKNKADELAKQIIKKLDKAAQKNIIHENKVARIKSRMMKKIKALKK